MGEHSLGEVIGFWITMSGLVGTLVVAIVLLRSDQAVERSTDWAEKYLRVHPLVLICLPVVSILAIFIGMHVMFVNGGGAYPGYPLDIIIEWLKS